MTNCKAVTSLSIPYKLKHEWASRGYDGNTCWVQCRAGAIPPGGAESNRLPVVVMTMQKLLLAGSDVFFELNEMRTDDLAAIWNGPAPHPDTLGRRVDDKGLITVICDATPRWHAATGKLLSTGHVAQYKGDVIAPDPRDRATAYTVYKPESRAWSDWRVMAMPEGNQGFQNSGAGSAQRFDLENGDILLPVYFSRQASDGSSSPCLVSTVCRCRFDGETLHYLEHGDELTSPVPRGFAEPSITRFNGRFFLTLRNDERGWVTSGADGLHFDPPRPWVFDDGTELGNYNTQQHWVTHSDGLFLVYTRRGWNNDHVFRHRAPLLMAEVDPERLCVVRATERVVAPERGARLGNFAVTEVSENETWITVSEWMQNGGDSARLMLDKLGLRNEDDSCPALTSRHYASALEGFGSDNTVWVARIIWSRPNRFSGVPRPLS